MYINCSVYRVHDLRVHVCWVAKCVSGVTETFEDIQYTLDAIA